MAELQALQAVVTQLGTDVTALAAAGLIPATALTALTTSLTAIDAQIKALLPATS